MLEGNFACIKKSRYTEHNNFYIDLHLIQKFFINLGSFIKFMKYLGKILFSDPKTTSKAI